jgi:hypothetical protein
MPMSTPHALVSNDNTPIARRKSVNQGCDTDHHCGAEGCAQFLAHEPLNEGVINPPGDDFYWTGQSWRLTKTAEAAWRSSGQRAR